MALPKFDFIVGPAILIYLATLITELVSSVPFGLVQDNYGGGCVLSSKIFSNNDSIKVDSFGSKTLCEFCTYLTIFTTLFPLIYGGYFLYALCQTLENASQVWVLPALMFNSLLMVLKLISSCILSLGFAQLCSEVTKDNTLKEYQTQLVQRVKDDIEALHEKFKRGYSGSKDEIMSRKRDLPPVASSIIWARQIEKKLTAYMSRVEDVLGKGWENHVEGQKLKQDGQYFCSKLDTKVIFEEWAQKVQQRNMAMSGHIFAIESTRSHRTGRSDGQKVLRPRVNFKPEIITLAKEVRNLKWLGFRIPLSIVNKAHHANQLYPFAVSLMESMECECSARRRIHGGVGTGDGFG